MRFNACRYLYAQCAEIEGMAMRIQLPEWKYLIPVVYQFKAK